MTKVGGNLSDWLPNRCNEYAFTTLSVLYCTLIFAEHVHDTSCSSALLSIASHTATCSPTSACLATHALPTCFYSCFVPHHAHNHQLKEKRRRTKYIFHKYQTRARPLPNQRCWIRSKAEAGRPCHAEQQHALFCRPNSVLV